MGAALDGISVVELATQTPGKQCTCLLADLGAAVVRVERPGVSERLSAEDQVLNRNKRSIVLNLRADAGRDALLRLCTDADVLLEGYRPQVAARLRIGYDDLRRGNPRLVYCSLSSFGQTGPLAGLAAFDIVTQAYAGILDLQTPAGERPRPPAVYLADICGTLMATIGILTALSARERSGRGQYVDVAMLDGLLYWFAGLLGPEALRGETPPDAQAEDPGYGAYETADGRTLVVGVFRDQSWAALCRLLGHPEFSDARWGDAGSRHRIREAFAARFRTRPRDEWIQLLHEHDVEAGPVNTLAEALLSEQVRARQMVLEVGDLSGAFGPQIGVPLAFSESPGGLPRAAPLPGQDTAAVLSELGYSSEEIAAIRADHGS